MQLQEISQEFDLLYQSWVSGLRENLKSESSQENLRQIADRDQEPIRAYIQSGQLPERLTERFVSALSDTLQGLDKITIEGADLMLALTRPSMPCTTEEFETRFRKFLGPLYEGKDLTKVRIQIDW